MARTDSVEIERKFLLRALPPFPEGALAREILQGWIPGEKIRERLRRVREGRKERFFRTIKVGRGIQRFELEDETTRGIFTRLWPLTRGKRIRKIRHVIPAARLIWEIDEFLDRDLFLAEVELRRPDQRVPVPRWLAPFIVREVTDEDGYVNFNLAR